MLKNLSVQVQSVFDDFQKKAVEFYNSSPVAKATEDMLETKSEPSSDSSAVSAARENAQKLEARLEVRWRRGKWGAKIYFVQNLT